MYGHSDLNELSKYYDLTSYNKITYSSHHILNVLHVNARSVPKNFDNITAFLNSLFTFPDILSVTETWLTDTNKDLFQLPGYYSYHLTRTVRPHGGVSVFISNSIQSQQIPECTMTNEDIEINTVKIFTSSETYILCSIYRPHSKYIAVEEFTNILCSLLETTTLKRNKIIIMGDLNINLLEHATHNPTNNFLASLQAMNFYPHISRPTRFPDTPNLGLPSLLDHIFTNFNNTYSSGIIHFPLSDHLPVFLNIAILTKTAKLHKIEFRNFSHSNNESFTTKLNAIDWHTLLSSPDVNCNTTIFLNTLQGIYNVCFPLKTKFISEKRLCNPWINQTLINSIKNKNNMYKDFKVGAITEGEFKQYRNRLNRIIKDAKQTYYISIFTNFKNNTRKIWDTINSFHRKNIRNITTDHIFHDNSNLTNPIQIAEAFNEFYTNIAPDLDSKLPPAFSDPLNFLKGNYPTSMVVPPVYPQEVIDVITSLKNKKVTLMKYRSR